MEPCLLKKVSSIVSGNLGMINIRTDDILRSLNFSLQNKKCQVMNTVEFLVLKRLMFKVLKKIYVVEVLTSPLS